LERKIQTGNLIGADDFSEFCKNWFIKLKNFFWMSKGVPAKLLPIVKHENV
jgi:hypothetical protein